MGDQTTIVVPPTGDLEVGRLLLGENVARANARDVSRVQCVVIADAGALVIRAAGKNPCMWRRSTGGAWTLLKKPHECRLADGDLLALDKKQKDGTVFVVSHESEPLAPQPAATDPPPPQPAVTEPAVTEPPPQPAAEPTLPTSTAMELSVPPPAAPEHPRKRCSGCSCAGHPNCCALCCRICYTVCGGSDSDEEGEAQVLRAAKKHKRQRKLRGPSPPPKRKPAAPAAPSTPPTRPMPTPAAPPAPGSPPPPRTAQPVNRTWPDWRQRRQQQAVNMRFALVSEYREQQIGSMTDFVVMEKFDGVRVAWEPEEGIFRTRADQRITPPQFFAAALPHDLRLDGELFLDRGLFNQTTSIVLGKDEDKWATLKYMVFDAPEAPGGFVSRLEAARARLAGAPCFVQVVETRLCETADEMKKMCDEVVEKQGEGLILRKAHSAFVAGEDDDFLKVKKRNDSEAVVLQHSEKKDSMKMKALNGHHAGKCFNLTCKFEKKPRPGSIVTFIWTPGVAEHKPRLPRIKAVHDRGTCACQDCTERRPRGWPAW